MSSQMQLYVGESYGYGEEREYLPFRTRITVDLGYLGNDKRNNVEQLHELVSVSSYRKIDLVVYDEPQTKDDHYPLRMLPVTLVLKELRKDIRKGYEHYEMAINAIETCVKYYPDTHVVLFMRS
jgi:hypothetical protein